LTSNKQRKKTSNYDGDLYGFQIGLPNEECFVKEMRRNVTKQCIFPFIYNKTKHYGCQPDENANGKFWCSTNVDVDKKHISGGGYWGHCGENCYIDPDSKGISFLPKKTKGSSINDFTALAMGGGVIKDFVTIELKPK
jgi:hypothetical protein